MSEFWNGINEIDDKACCFCYSQKKLLFIVSFSISCLLACLLAFLLSCFLSFHLSFSPLSFYSVVRGGQTPVSTPNKRALPNLCTFMQIDRGFRFRQPPCNPAPWLRSLMKIISRFWKIP